MLAFVPSFYRHGLNNRVQAVLAFAQLAFRASGAGHDQLERINEQIRRLCSGWPVERLAEVPRRGHGGGRHARPSRPARHGKTPFDKDHEMITARPSQAGPSVLEMR